jgi:hypothetical protein
MIGSTIKEMTESILDDSVDDVLFYQLVNVAKNTIENERPWMFLRAVDDTQTSTTGNNSTTPRSLPKDWRRTYKMLIGRDMQITQVPFDEQHLWRQSSYRFCVDVANSQYYLLGATGVADTIYHYYIKKTPEITSATSWEPTVLLADYDAILAFMVAGYIMAGVDADDIFARMSVENKVMAQTIKASMVAWDMQLQIDAQSGFLGFGQQATGIDLGMM